MDQSATGKLCPLKEYSAIGFDLDHCLIRYVLEEFVQIPYRAYAQVMVEDKKYPEEILELGNKEMSLMQNAMILDISNGNVIKLGEGKVVLRAFHGFKRLSDDEVEKIYGNPPTFEKFDPHIQNSPDYFCALTFFQNQMPALFSRIIQYRIDNNLSTSQADYQQILKDILYSISKSYTHYDKDICHPVMSYGYYFPKVLENIEKTVYKQERMAKALQGLKEKGKILFIVSNSNFEPVDILMEYAYGKDWRKLFDFVIAKGHKPVFFDQKTIPFRCIDHSEEHKLGKTTQEIDNSETYLEGNYKFLEENIQKVLGSKELGKILYFGDQYHSDVLASAKNPGWDSVCIMEELSGVELGKDCDKSVCGDYFSEETKYGKIETFWWSFLKKTATKVTSFVDSDDMIEFYKQE